MMAQSETRRNRLAIFVVLFLCTLVLYYNFIRQSSPTSSTSFTREIIQDDDEVSPIQKSYPEHWGEPPAFQTRDYRELPGGYGYGRSTLARWIEMNLQKDEEEGLIEQPEYLP
jgi:hypothetical protein